ncbi:MAG: hypothetical protein EXX96DRAFT_571205 [Benjaminiella poitrasii]|nr:MAG: hypothetical protein EXX96DRAFT_571205 [Benjaminiella poitrasii]
MKNIESLAMTDIKAAYCECLNSQITYAMTEDEGYFEIYAFLLKILKEKPNILNSASKEKFAKGDYVVTLWSRIFSTVFEDRSENLFCTWTDTVPEGSSAEKRSSQDASSTAIGDKIDLRIWI